MLRNLYHRVLRLSAGPRAPWWLALVAFTESSFFPVPPDALLVPMAAARPDRAWRLAAICTAASVAGALLGYWIGAVLYDVVALPVIRFYHYEAAAGAVVDSIQRYGVWFILIKGLTPIPFKVVTIACGAARLELVPFLLACIATRGVRFFLEAAVLRRYGAPVLALVERRLTLVAVASVLAVVAGFVALKVL